jgi:hypothetical protein
MSNKAKWTLLVGAFLLVAIVAMIVGFYLAGFDILGWFKTRYAFIVYIVVGFYVLIASYVFIMEYIQK